MVILGFGSNLGDRLKQFRQALSLLKQVPSVSIQQISPLYISDALLPENAPDSWNTPYLNFAVKCECHLKPLELLQHIKQIEKVVGRIPEKNWGPRVIDIDILAWDDLVQYDEILHIPHEHLHERPFALWPLTDLAPRWMHPIQNKTAVEIAAHWPSRFDGSAPLHAKQINHRIDKPALMGILNITPDSFSADGKINSFNIDDAYQLVNSGAEILDIGAEATGPKAEAITAEIEWQRLKPVLSIILNEREKMLIPPKISIDTRHAEVAEKALELGVDWINDVSGLDNPNMRAVLKNYHCDIVFMHHLGIPVSQQKTLSLSENPVEQVYAWAKQRIHELEKDGIGPERLIFDVGIGFGKTAEQSFELIKQISEFKKLGVRLLVGHSRKSFLNLFTTKIFAERDIETCAISQYLASQDVDYLRVHNVAANAITLKIAKAASHNLSSNR